MLSKGAKSGDFWVEIQFDSKLRTLSKDNDNINLNMQEI